MIVFSSGGHIVVSRGVTSGLVASGGALIEVDSNTEVVDTDVLAGGTLFVVGSAAGTTISAYGSETVYGGVDSGSIDYGNVEVGGETVGMTIMSGGSASIGGMAVDVVVESGAIENLGAGVDIGAKVSGSLYVGGGVASNTTVFAGGVEWADNGSAVGATVLSGGTLDARPCRAAAPVTDLFHETWRAAVRSPCESRSYRDAARSAALTADR